MTRTFRSALVCLLVTAVTLFGPGCPRTTITKDPSGNVKQGRVTVLVQSASKALSQALLEAVAPKSVVAAAEIYSLKLTVTEISLDQDGEDDGDVHDGGDDSGDDDGEVNDDHGDHGGDGHDGDVEDGEDGDSHDGDVNDNEDGDSHDGDVEDGDSHDGGDKHDDESGDDGDTDDGEVSDGGDGDHGDEDGEDNEDNEDNEDEGNDDSVVIFQGSQDIDLVSLDNLSQVFSATDIPAGVYHRITLKIENPRLRLVSDPDTEITDIHLTCDDRLFVDATFEIPEDGNSLVMLTFNGVNLIREGNGTYVLTPHLDAGVTVTSADVSATGAIASVDSGNDSLVVTLADGDVTVLYAGAAIFLPTDTDTPTGTGADLLVGATVEIVGTIDLDGAITAAEIHLL